MYDYRGKEAIVRSAIQQAGAKGILQRDLYKYLAPYKSRKAAVHRAVETLLRWGVIRRQPEGKSYRLFVKEPHDEGTQAEMLAKVFRTDLDRP